MTAILFCDGQPAAEQAALLDQLRPARQALRRARDRIARSRRRHEDHADDDGEIARLFGAGPGHALSSAPRSAHRRTLEDHRARRNPADRSAFAWEARRHEHDDIRRPRSAYEALATAIDAAGPEREALFLTRLALVLGHELGDVAASGKPSGRRSRAWHSPAPSSRSPPRGSINFSHANRQILSWGYPGLFRTSVAIFAAHHMMIIIQ